MTDNTLHTTLEHHVRNAAEGVPKEPIGAYQALSILGTGGMGVVYRAQRVDGQYEQSVALKVLSAWAEPDSKYRFLQERQIVARLTHPNIAHFYDGGIADNGALYFAMELIEGAPLTEYVRTHGCTLEQRLRLMMSVCEAVQYAHQQLIVHRDLKPSNILITEDGAPKLLDFGIAKLVEASQSDDKTQYTQTNAMTPAYAAPEQFAGLAVSTQTDVYALGVVLYELLTGSRPHMARAGAALATQVMTETPLAPSSLLRSREQSGDATRPRAQIRTISADLDLIVLNCLHKEPQRRYATANALAQDLRAYLEQRPIAARADSFSYRARKYLRRNRGGVAAGLGALLLLIGALVYSMAMTQRARAEAERAGAISQFLQSLFESAHPSRGGMQMSARDILQNGVRTARGQWSNDPAILSEIELSIARAQIEIGDYAPALRVLDVQAERMKEGAVSAQFGLLRARALRGMDELERAAQIAEQALAGVEKDSAIELELERERAHIALVQRDLQTAERWIQRAQTHASNPNEQISLRLLEIEFLLHSERWNEARDLSNATYAYAVESFGAQHVNTAAANFARANVAENINDFPSAHRAYAQTLAVYDTQLGPSHARTLQVRDAFGFSQLRAGMAIQAEATLQQALNAAKQQYGDKHSSVATLEVSLASLHARQGNLPKALAFAESAYAQRKGLFSSSALELLESQNILASVLSRMGKNERAVQLLSKSRAALESLPPASREKRLNSVEMQLAELQRRGGNCEQAMPLYRAILTRLGSDPSAQVGGPGESAIGRLSQCLFATGALPEAIKTADRAMELSEMAGATPAHRWLALLVGGMSQGAQNNREEANKLLAEAKAQVDAQFGPDSPAAGEVAAAMKLLKN